MTQSNDTNQSTSSHQPLPSTYVGVLTALGSGGLVTLDHSDPIVGSHIDVPERSLHGAPFGMKVVVRAKGPCERNKTRGEIVEVLGDPAHHDVAMLAIIRRYGLHASFPPDVVAEADTYPYDLDEAAVQAALAQGARDLRSRPTITIDGEDAKDLDDAVDVEMLANGQIRLCVHIADVTHYVKPGSALDREARERGNSVYLVDRVLPMLPPRLSNGLCSLNPHAARRTVTCQMDLADDGHVTAYELFESVITSKVRSSYTEVYETLTTGQVRPGRPVWFFEALSTMRRVAETLSAMRRRRGALVFDFPETHVELDGDGHPLKVYAYPTTFANDLIESFMIAANETVAHALITHHRPTLFRVHDAPDPERIALFCRLAASLGVSHGLRGGTTPKALSQTLEALAGQPFEKTLSELLLKSLAKAEYRAQNDGHFGLASREYLHFTSPIRRYADDVVHRAVKALIHHKPVRGGRAALDDLARHVSEMERRAVDAERDGVARKAAEYYAERLGETYEGVIMGMSTWACYVELPTSIQGAIPFRTLDGHFVYHPERLSAEGPQGKTIHIGDPVVVRIAAVDINRGRIDLALVHHQQSIRVSPHKGQVKRAKPNKTRRLKRRRR